MKRIWVIGLILASFLASCTSALKDTGTEVAEQGRMAEGTSLALSAIDSLMWRQPDSALALLLPYFDTCCRDVSRNVSRIPNVLGDVSGNVSTTTEHDNHYAQLLLSELLYKNDYKQTNRRDLQKAVNYFDSLTLTLNDTPSPKRLIAGKDPLSLTRNGSIAFLDARAHYINGVGYYENDSVVEACKEYLKALEVMEERFEEKELVGKKAKFMTLIYTHLLELFSDMYLHEQAIYFGKSSLAYYKKYHAEPWHIAWVLNMIGSHFDILENYDSAYIYCNRGLGVVSDTNCLIYRDISTHLASLSYKLNYPSKTSINKLHTLLAEANSEKEYVSRCLTIGEIFYHEQQFDSAWSYLNIVYDQDRSVGAKKQAAEWLIEIGKMQGKNAKVNEFADFLVPFANLEENHSSTKTQLTALYNSLIQSHYDNQHHIETKKHLKRTISIVGGLLVLLLVIIVFYYRSTKSKKELEKQIETERHTHKMQQAAMAGRLKRSNAKLREQKKLALASSAILPMNQKNTMNYIEEPICKHILTVCNDKSNPIKSTVPVSSYAKIALSDVQKAELKVVAMRHYGQLFDKLRQLYPELKEKDYLYFTLCLLGLDNAQIAVLLQKSISTIWDRENRLKRIFGSEDKVVIILNGFLIS